MRSYLLIALCCALGYGLIFLLVDKRPSGESAAEGASVPVFAALQGPEVATPLPRAEDFVPDPAQHRGHDRHAAALLVTDTDSSWYGLASGLRSIGLPYRLVDSVAEALQHEFIIAYPRLSGALLQPQELQQLAAHVREGGTLIGFGVLGGGLEPVFGFAAALEADLQGQLDFVSEAAFMQELTRLPQERSLRFGAEGDPASGLPALVYDNPKLPPLALYADGRPAIVYNEYAGAQGAGRAVAFGIDLGHLLLRAHNARFSGLEGSYVNEYRPGGDTLLRLLAALYRAAEPNAVLLSPTPQGREVSVLLTHDVDFTVSLANLPAYVAVEREAGVPATWFIQTKYVKDYNDDLFFDPVRVEVMRELAMPDLEVGSHSVSHSNEFRNMPVGDGRETYPQYQPFVFDFSTVRNASILGELRVSRFLLEHFAEQKVQAFRPGHLSLPQALPQLLQASGYRYSSSMTANEALTHLPFRSMYDRAYSAPVDVFEFPVSIEDESGDLLERLDASLALTDAVAAYRGLVTLLVHTETQGDKLEFVRRYIAAVRERAWFGTVSGYGDWWRQRDSASLQWQDAAAPQPRLRISVDGTVDGLTLQLPTGWRALQMPPGSVQNGDWLSLGAFTRDTEVLLHAAAEDR